jgi:hypothetical protein
MKAEHRKQLQTNVLADRMGRFVQTLKQRPRKRTLLYVALGIAVVVTIVVILRIRTRGAEEESRRWVMLDNGNRLYLDELAGVQVSEDGQRITVPYEWKYGKMNVGKAARLEYVWFTFWDDGVKLLAARPENALRSINFARNLYAKLAEDNCKGDPVWEPESRYCIAVAEECFAVLDRKYLDSARTKYAEVAKQFPNSAAGKRAEQRAEILKEKSATLERARKFYADLERDLGIDAKKLKEDLKLSAE